MSPYGQDEDVLKEHPQPPRLFDDLADDDPAVVDASPASTDGTGWNDPKG